MTIPSRPAPPPPNKFNFNGSTANSNHHVENNSRKPAPPRPPPPSKGVAPAPPKKSGILSNLFGSSKQNKTTINVNSNNISQVKIPPKLPAPPVMMSNRTHQQNYQQQPMFLQTNIKQLSNDIQLIDFDESKSYSPPPLIKKSNTGGSDSVSIDSFCSSTSSPTNNLGAVSQSESGFEDDFSVSDFKVSSSAATSRSTTFSSDPFDCSDDFTSNKPTIFQQPTNIRNLKPTILPKPTSVGNTNFFTSSSSSSLNVAVPSSSSSSSNHFEDSLNNGKSLIKPAAFCMPTIIKPMSVKGKSSPTNIIELKKTETIKEIPSSSSFDEYEDEPPSPPMPTVPPPPPPTFDCEDDEVEPHAYAIYDFNSDVAEDLNLKANEKIYLIQQMNDEWMFGRNKRGCEGIFPINYVDIRVPLKHQVEPDSGNASRSESVSPAVEGHRVKVLYTFNAETADDLTILEGETVSVIYEITPEWLYGTNDRAEYGQFPANYIEYVPQNLPQMPK